MTGTTRTRSNLLLVIVAAAVFVGVAAVTFLRSSSSNEAERASGVIGLLDDQRLALGEPAPDFALTSVRAEDEVLRLSDFRGKAVVLNFYASWCSPCRKELPDFEAVSRELSDRVVFIAINVQESRSQALGILEETGVTFPAVLDANGEIASRYGLRGMPSTYILDASGVVRSFGPGATDAERLRIELLAVLSGER